MKTLIVYYSLTGNTAYIAEKLAKGLGADALRLEAQKAYPDKGFKKFFWGGKSAVMGEKPALVPYTCDLSQYERVIIASPVWAGTFAPPLRTFIEDKREALNGKKFAALLCCAGGDTFKPFEKLRSALNVEQFEAQAVLVDPKDKPAPEKDAALKQFMGALGAPEGENQ